jgi:tetratricopeptide (TPR) repeat protein
MKKIIAIILITVNITNAQNKTADSLLAEINKAKTDTARIRLMNNIIYEIYSLTQQERIDYSKKILDLSRKNDDKILESVITAELGYIMAINGNTLQGTELVYSALELAKKHNNDLAFGIIYNDLGICFRSDTIKSTTNFLTAIKYSIKAGDDPTVAYTYMNISRNFSTRQYKDSALFYAQKAYEYCISKNITEALGSSFLRLGIIHYYLLDNKTIGFEYVRRAVSDKHTIENPDLYLTAINVLADLFQNEGNTDSALFYTNKAFTKMDKARYSSVLDVYALYKKIYTPINSDSALKYYQLYESKKDSIDRLSNIQQQQLLSIKKDLEYEKDAVQRKQNIQYALIALGIIAFIILFLLLSRRYITNTNIIRFLGVIALLVVFEFLNLLLHPFLERITHHSPVIMLLALVCIAALLVPLHHKLEKWAIHKLVEKNKRIRLAAAKKTIEQLERE